MRGTRQGGIPLFQIGVDIGGTFTDFAILDEASGQVRTLKTPTTYPDPLQGIVTGLDELQIDLARVSRFLHGTTIGTNAILQRRGVSTALVTTRGFRDHIEIGDNLRYTGGLFDPHWMRTRPLVPISRRFEVRERVLGDGSVVTKLDLPEARAAVAAVKASGARAVAVCFVNSYVNPAHERAVGELLRRGAPGVDVTLSSDVVPEWREYPRFSTAVLNAYVQPLLKNYLEALGETLRAGGYRGELLLMASNAGLISAATAGTLPVRLVLSGPAAGVVAGMALGRTSERPNLITYDMGGTSTDVCLIQDGRPDVSSRRVLEAFPIMTPMVDINTVGAGGGSIASVDATGALRVGPESAGADPGPACYGRGGTAFTITDANLLLGRVSPRGLLDGKVPLDRGLAEAAAQRVNALAGFPDTLSLADAVVRIAVTSMTGAVRSISVQRGHDPRDYALVPFGGAGPMHAIPVADDLGIGEVLVPRAPGNVCALGLLGADIRHDLVRSFQGSLAGVDVIALEASLRELEQKGRGLLAQDGVPRNRVEIQHVLSLRYTGQSFELDLPVARPRISIARVTAAFDALHLKNYGYHRGGHGVDIVKLRVAAIGRLDGPEPAELAAGGSAAKALSGSRKATFDGRTAATPVYERDLLPAGATIAGPALIEEPGSLTVVFPGWRAAVDRHGNIVMRRTAKGGRK